MANPAEKTNVAKLTNGATNPRVKIKMYPFNELNDKMFKKSDNSVYYNQKASIIIDDNQPTIPTSFYVRSPEDAYQEGHYIADIQIRSGQYGRPEFSLSKPRLIQEPK